MSNIFLTILVIWCGFVTLILFRSNTITKNLLELIQNLQQSISYLTHNQKILSGAVFKKPCKAEGCHAYGFPNSGLCYHHDPEWQKWAKNLEK